MIKASGKTRIVLIIACVLLIIGGMWMLFFAKKRILPTAGKANPMYQRNVKTLKLKGNIRSIMVVKYTQQAPADEFDDLVAYQNFEFDKSGNVIHQVVYDRNDELAIDEVYVYDRAGNYISCVSNNVQAQLVLRESLRFDNQGRLLEISHDARGEKKRYILEYKDTLNGYIQTKFELKPSLRALTRKIVFDTLNREQRTEQIFSGGKKQWLNNRYDKRGNMIVETMFDSVHVPVYQYVASYNTNDLVVREEYTIRGHTEHYYAYDEQGSIIEYTRIESGDIDPRSYRAVYKYDDQGNWIHCDILRLDGTPKASIDRAVKYY